MISFSNSYIKYKKSYIAFREILWLYKYPHIILIIPMIFKVVSIQGPSSVSETNLKELTVNVLIKVVYQIKQ